MPSLQAYFLGSLEIHLNQEPLFKPPTLKSQSLLAYLILNRHQVQPRDRLVGLFWGDRPERRARRSLTTALWHIRRCLRKEEYLLSDSHQIQFDPQADLWLDVDQFETLAQRETPHDLQAAANLYRGDLLENFYDDWLITERYRLQTMFFEVLVKLMIGQEQAGAFQAALATALRLLDHDPLREDAHRLVMNAYCRLGRRHTALEHYQKFQELLRAELDAEPMAATVKLYQAILDGQIPETVPRQEVALPPDPARHRSPKIIRGNFVGREQELSFLNRQWEQIKAGQGTTVLIRGEAGVGKSRLLEEFTNRLHWQGSRILEGRCYQFERALPYQPIADAVRVVLSTLNPAELDNFPKWAWGELARLVPGLLESELDLDTGSAIHTDEERVRLFDAVSRLLASLSSKGPLIIVLEDLHWATESSLQLLHYLARQLGNLPLLIVVTWRPEAVPPNNSLIALEEHLVRQRLAQPLDLGRLSPAAVESLLMDWSGTRAVAPLARRLHQETEGNPYFVIEMITTLLDTGVIRLKDSVWQGDFLQISQDQLPLPAGVSETLLVRVGRLSERTQELLRLAAVLGREFDFDPLESTWGQGEEATLEALDELLRRKLIREGSGLSGKDYVFDHALVQETVYRSTHHRRRQLLHRLVGRTMEKLDTHGPSSAGELAHHFERAGETDIALGYLVTAGEQAQAIFAFREALDLFSRALALTPAGRTDALAARALAGWSASQREINGDNPKIWTNLRKALAIWKGLDKPAQVAENCFMLAFQHADFELGRDLVRQGLDAIQGHKHLEPLKARGYGLLARFHEHEGNFAQARVWAEQQRQLCEEIGDQSELARAYHRLGSILLRIGGPMEIAANHSQKAAQLAEELGWLDFAAGSHNIAGHCLLALGRTREAEKVCQRALQLSIELDIPWRQAWCYHGLAEIASLRGNWDQAHQLLDQAEALMVQQPSHFQEIAILRTRGQLYSRQGNQAAACSVLEKALDMSQHYYPRYIPSLELSQVSHCLQKDDLAAARQKLAIALEHLASSRNDHAQSSAQRLKGQLAAHDADWASAEETFAQGLHLSNTLGQVIEAAKIQLAWGESLLSHDPDRARELLKSALTTFETAEAQYLVEKIHDLLP